MNCIDNCRTEDGRSTGGAGSASVERGVEAVRAHHPTGWFPRLTRFDTEDEAGNPRASPQRLRLVQPMPDAFDFVATPRDGATASGCVSTSRLSPP